MDEPEEIEREGEKVLAKGVAPGGRDASYVLQGAVIVSECVLFVRAGVCAVSGLGGLGTSTPLVGPVHIFTFLNLATFVRLSCEYVRYTGVSLRQDK